MPQKLYLPEINTQNANLTPEIGGLFLSQNPDIAAGCVACLAGRLKMTPRPVRMCAGEVAANFTDKTAPLVRLGFLMNQVSCQKILAAGGVMPYCQLRVEPPAEGRAWETNLLD